MISVWQSLDDLPNSSNFLAAKYSCYTVLHLNAVTMFGWKNFDKLLKNYQYFPSQSKFGTIQYVTSPFSLLQHMFTLASDATNVYKPS